MKQNNTEAINIDFILSDDGLSVSLVKLPALWHCDSLVNSSELYIRFKKKKNPHKKQNSCDI